jgi:hypothetical protein
MLDARDEAEAMQMCVPAASVDGIPKANGKATLGLRGLRVMRCHPEVRLTSKGYMKPEKTKGLLANGL